MSKAKRPWLPVLVLHLLSVCVFLLQITSGEYVERKYHKFTRLFCYLISLVGFAVMHIFMPKEQTITLFFNHDG